MSTRVINPENDLSGGSDGGLHLPLRAVHALCRSAKVSTTQHSSANSKNTGNMATDISQ